MDDAVVLLLALVADWQREVGQLHDAFLRDDKDYLDKYEQQFT